jgi:hypothetical protein
VSSKRCEPQPWTASFIHRPCKELRSRRRKAGRTAGAWRPALFFETASRFRRDGQQTLTLCGSAAARAKAPSDTILPLWPRLPSSRGGVEMGWCRQQSGFSGLPPPREVQAAGGEPRLIAKKCAVSASGSQLQSERRGLARTICHLSLCAKGGECSWVRRLGSQLDERLQLLDGL